MIVHIVAKQDKDFDGTSYWFLGAHTKGLYYYIRSSGHRYYNRSKLQGHHIKKYK